MHKIFWKDSVVRDIKNIDRKMQDIIKKAVEEEISKDHKIGKVLKGNFKGCFSHRIGDYRVIYTVISQGILVLRVGHRKEVYRE